MNQVFLFSAHRFDKSSNTQREPAASCRCTHADFKQQQLWLVVRSFLQHVHHSLATVQHLHANTSSLLTTDDLKQTGQIILKWGYIRDSCTAEERVGFDTGFQRWVSLLPNCRTSSWGVGCVTPQINFWVRKLREFVFCNSDLRCNKVGLMRRNTEVLWLVPKKRGNT